MSTKRHSPDIAPEIGPKTYAETQGQPAFDWNAFLRNPPDGGSLAHGRATRLAADWVTCACGNQCAVIPRTKRDEYGSGGGPQDRELNDLGNQFYWEIGAANWSRALQIIARIEARSAELIASLLTP